MTRKIEITIGDRKTGTETKALAHLSPEEIEALEAYCRYAEELWAVKFLKDGAPTKLKMHYIGPQGLAASAELPPDEDVIVFLHKLRPLILNDEHASFNRVTGTIGRHFTDPNIRGVLKKLHEMFDGRRMQRQFTMESNGVILNSEKTLNDWLNGFEYHRVQEKRKQIEHLHELLPLESGRALFLMLLTDKACAIAELAAFINLLLGRTKTVQVEREN